MPAMTKNIAILMATYNGAAFLRAQLDSIAAQTHTDWALFVSDDGSTDATMDILRDYQQRWGTDKLRILSGPRAGFAKNFLSLVANADIEADYFAFCDQDDVWREEKLSKAVSFLSECDDSQASLYCSRTELIDERNQHIGYSPYFERPPSFNNALVQSIAGGNTMVFNAKAKALAKVLATHEVEIASHDWTLYQLVSGSGGTIFYDDWASIRYRQHGANLVGSNAALVARMNRGFLFFAGRFRRWTDMNVTALGTVNGELTKEARADLDEFMELRKAGVALKVKNVSNPRYRRQTKISTLAVSIGLALGLV